MTVLRAAVTVFAVVVSLVLSVGVAGAGDGPWGRVRECESGQLGYTAATGNGFFGAYQFSAGTWDAVAAVVDPMWVGVRPDRAPAWVQDRMAQALAFEVPWGGPRHWPVCGAALVGVTAQAAAVGLAAPPRSGSFGRSGDVALECQVDGRAGLERVAVRGKVWFVDLDGRGGPGELELSFGVAGDVAVCADFDGDGFDEPGVVRGDILWRGSWTSGPATGSATADGVRCAAQGCGR